MKKNDYKNMEKKDLLKTLYEKRVDLRTFRFGESGSKTRNIKKGINLKKDIARIMTQLNSKKVKGEK